MTTIAWDGKTLAADRQISWGDQAMGRVTKIRKRKKDGALVGTTGLTAPGHTFREWFVNGESKFSVPKMDYENEPVSALIIRANGGIEYVTKHGTTPIEGEFIAIGSGADYALGAMAAGKTAKEAVEIASKFDGCSGDGVDVLELGHKK